MQLGDKIPFLSEVYTYNIFFWQGVRLEGEEASDVRDQLVRDQRMFGTIGNFATSKYNFVTYFRDGQCIFKRICLSRSAFCREVYLVTNLSPEVKSSRSYFSQKESRIWTKVFKKRFVLYGRTTSAFLDIQLSIIWIYSVESTMLTINIIYHNI